MKRITAIILAFVLCFSFTAFGAGDETVKADSSVFSIREITEPVSFHTDLQKEVLDAGYENILDYCLPVSEIVERSIPAGITVSWTYEGKQVPETFTVSVSTNEDMSDALVFEADPAEQDGVYSYAIQNCMLDTTYYYTVSDGTDTSEVSSFTVDDAGPRNIYVDGVTNIRDLGGWKTNSGKTVRQGLLYRCGQLNENYTQDLLITEEGIRTMLDVLGIRTEVDFRTEDDNENGGITQSPLGETVQYCNFPMELSYLDEYEDSVKAFFQLLADESNYPIIFHCKIGTDRTGFMTYLLYGLLDVPMDSIYTDYVFSNLGVIDGSRNHKQWKKKLKEVLGKDNSKGTPQENSLYYLRNIGITDEEIEKITAILLED